MPVSSPVSLPHLIFLPLLINLNNQELPPSSFLRFAQKEVFGANTLEQNKFVYSVNDLQQKNEMWSKIEQGKKH